MLGLFLSLSLACTNLGLGNRFVYLYANSSHLLKRLCNRLLCNHSSQWLHFQAQGNSDFSHAETRGELGGGGVLQIWKENVFIFGRHLRPAVTTTAMMIMMMMLNSELLYTLRLGSSSTFSPFTIWSDPPVSVSVMVWCCCCRTFEERKNFAPWPHAPRRRRRLPSKSFYHSAATSFGCWVKWSTRTERVHRYAKNGPGNRRPTGEIDSFVSSSRLKPSFSDPNHLRSEASCPQGLPGIPGVCSVSGTIVESGRLFRKLSLSSVSSSSSSSSVALSAARQPSSTPLGNRADCRSVVWIAARCLHVMSRTRSAFRADSDVYDTKWFN